jgi:predicted ATPase
MHLTRIQIPEFRALKNVDITFEKDFTPKVFPLGSENGGGKSTLLQLIFVLLHCANHSDKSAFVENMLARYRLPEGVNQQTLAKMDIWDGEKTVQIEFLCCNDDFLTPISNTNHSSFSTLFKERQIKEQLGLLKEELDEVQGSSSVDNKLSLLREIERLKKEEYANAKKAYNDLSHSVKPIFEYLHTERCLYITTYSEKEALLCRFVDFPLDNGEAFLSELSEKVFLVAPSTQVYLFMPEKEKKLIFQAYQKRRASYELALRKIKAELPNFFTYDFFSTDIIVKYFQDARNLDFEQAVNTGEYGNRYQQILNDINQILMQGKKILPQIQSSRAKASEEDPIEGIIFKTENGEILYPEDLSHGELKRLSLYVWTQYHRMKDAIVLMDEVENGFHPDWQYQIISDLVEWGANSQYILATHSYELCQAVTPAHVKELEPKLLPAAPNNL